MSPFDNSNPIHFLLVGCDRYDNMQDLSSVRQDLDRVHEILHGSEYSLYSEEQVIELYNANSQNFRDAIKNYLFSRSCERDTLVIYFSGHGTTIGRDDFGFCMQDVISHPDDGVVLPTSVIKLSEINACLNIKNISLILVIDACYSGQASKQMKVSFPEITTEMSTRLVITMGSNFGLITACSDNQEVPDIGVVSRAIKDFCEQGLDEKRQEILTFGNLAEILSDRIDLHAKGDNRSRIFIPPGKISKTGVCRNIQYNLTMDPTNIYSFTKPYLKVLQALWNDGNPTSLTPGEILEKTGSQSAYGNHNKLSLEHWELVDDGDMGGRVITARGIEFLNGDMKIPKTIIQNKITRECEIAPDSKYLHVGRKIDIMGNVEKILIEI